MHTIRLRHPWQCEPAGEGSQWSRKFNWPAELATDEVAWLVIEGAACSGEALLNDKPLASNSQSSRHDVTTLLAGHNRLVLSHDAPPPPDPRECPFDVRLEIATG